MAQAAVVPYWHSSVRQQGRAEGGHTDRSHLPFHESRIHSPFCRSWQCQQKFQLSAPVPFSVAVTFSESPQKTSSLLLNPRPGAGWTLTRGASGALGPGHPRAGPVPVEHSPS